MRLRISDVMMTDFHLGNWSSPQFFVRMNREFDCAETPSTKKNLIEFDGDDLAQCEFD